MSQRAICEISITGTENREWQGTVYFPDSGERRSFQSLVELIRTVEQNAPSAPSAESAE